MWVLNVRLVNIEKLNRLKYVNFTFQAKVTILKPSRRTIYKLIKVFNIHIILINRLKYVDFPFQAKMTVLKPSRRAVHKLIKVCITFT